MEVIMIAIIAIVLVLLVIDVARQDRPREKRLTIAEYAIARVKAQLEVTAAERELKPREQGLLELLTPVVEEYEARPSERGAGVLTPAL